MMTNRQLSLFCLIFITTFLLPAFGSPAAYAADSGIDQAIGPATVIFCDVSGSMQEKIRYKNHEGEESRIAKIALMKQWLIRLAADLSDMTCSIGIYRMHRRYEVIHEQ